MKRLTQKDLALRWGCCVRTIRRKIKGRLAPIDFTGNQPVFSEKDVRRYEAVRLKEGQRKQRLFERTGRISRMSAARRGTR